MVDEAKVVEEEIIEDLRELSVEEREEAWVNYVRSGVNSLLDIYLPVAENSDINIHYTPHLVEELETGPVVDKDKADAVLISLRLKFGTPINLTKPISTD